jgi:ABC-type xylose transport system permease subunit
VGVIDWSRMRREATAIVRAETHTHAILRSRLAFLLLATLVVDVIGTLAMYMLEHDDRRSGFTTLGGAFFWVSAQLTTVSSQEPNPVTGLGKAIDIGFEVWAISVVATLAASLATFFTVRHRERMQKID